jgi:hypothetical protein
MPLPIFVPRLATEDRPKPVNSVKHVPCVTCTKLDVVDDETGRCRCCWRIVTLMPAVLEGARR